MSKLVIPRQSEMNKITIPITNTYKQHEDIRAWMKDTFGAEVPRRPNNTRQRRQWSTHHDLWNRNIEVMVRNPAWLTHISLRWL